MSHHFKNSQQDTKTGSVLVGGKFPQYFTRSLESQSPVLHPLDVEKPGLSRTFSLVEG